MVTAKWEIIEDAKSLPECREKNASANAIFLEEKNIKLNLI